RHGHGRDFLDARGHSQRAHQPAQPLHAFSCRSGKPKGFGNDSGTAGRLCCLGQKRGTVQGQDLSRSLHRTVGVGTLGCGVLNGAANPLVTGSTNGFVIGETELVSATGVRPAKPPLFTALTSWRTRVASSSRIT